jgi:hypothetical protein
MPVIKGTNTLTWLDILPQNTQIWPKTWPLWFPTRAFANLYPSYHAIKTSFKCSKGFWGLITVSQVYPIRLKWHQQVSWTQRYFTIEIKQSLERAEWILKNIRLMCRFGCYMMKASERSISSPLDVIHTALCMVIKMSTKHRPLEYHPAASTQLQRGTQAAGPYKPRKGL